MGINLCLSPTEWQLALVWSSHLLKGFVPCLHILNCLRLADTRTAGKSTDPYCIFSLVQVIYENIINPLLPSIPKGGLRKQCRTRSDAAMRRLIMVYTVFRSITKTRLYNFDPLKPHFCIVKLGFTGVYIILLISAQKHRLWVLVRTASARQF